ncbi:MAG: PrsW family intramembrane metalloprotease [Candidatus Sungiibacteriota bacterium]|uniref:Protease PrsW n=1 Tax=Candidatus Sungiibacteriota bacterium TaxID=2750080 RepID=A0A7T5RKC3_9BACT|nr:MAG: PrsW family intramembrane metalloprotease [Candidatus Sungbacteria bacterium]
MAAVIATNLGYILLTFIPPVLWLLFYLREDRHPEPKVLLIITFLGGIAAALLAAVVEIFLVGKGGAVSSFITLEKNALLFFLIIALVEEYIKYLPVKLLITKRPDFDEPIDAMIYMMTAALGFAAIENSLFIMPLFREGIFAGLEVAANRFLGANLLHALSSGIVGFFLARAFFSPRHHHFVALGVIVASILHALFNYLILVRELLPQSTFYIILLLSIMAVMVFIDFERLKNNPKTKD